MVYKELTSSIVVRGSWNRSILNPIWLVSNIFEDKPDIKVEFSINFDSPTRYRIGNMILIPGDEKLILSSVDNSDESLKFMEKTAITLCQILQHTPFKAVGINFSLFENENKRKLIPLMNFSDKDYLSADSWIITQRTLSRHLESDFYKINFSIKMDENDDFHFDFNYHYPSTTIEEIIGNLKDKTLQYRDNTLQLLNTLYDLNLK
jgi:hypothetical protein